MRQTVREFLSQRLAAGGPTGAALPPSVERWNKQQKNKKAYRASLTELPVASPLRNKLSKS